MPKGELIAYAALSWSTPETRQNAGYRLRNTHGEHEHSSVTSSPAEIAIARRTISGTPRATTS